MQQSLKKHPYLIYILIIFCALPLIRWAIKSYRYGNEIAPIKKGLAEAYKREWGTFLTDTGRIYVYANRNKPKIGYSFNLDSNMRIKKGDYLLKLKSDSLSFSFSRDTTVGQVVCVLYDDKNSYDWMDRRRIHGIYFEPGTSRLLHSNYNLRLATTYLREGKTSGYFVAETFSKNSGASGSALARERIETIAKELKKQGVKMAEYSLSQF